jgi:cytidylate kinase
VAVITVSRQLGSHGARIAKSLAKELGWTFADKTLIDRVVRQYGLVRLDEIYDKPPSIWDLFNQDSTETIALLNRTMIAIARRGDAVILGRGGFAVLDGCHDVLDVLVTAPVDVRVERIAARDGLSVADATAKVRDDDAMRAKFLRLFYGRDWAREADADLVIDTSTTSDAAARAQITAAVRALPSPPAGARTTADLEVDTVLANTVKNLLS